MYTFNENNIMTGYIKELLHSFNLPKAKVWSSGMNVYANNFYIGEGQLVKALYSGSFTSLDDYIDYQKTKKAFIKIAPYYYGQSFLNVTKNLKLNNLLYDSYTHKYLGDYLRFYRDYKGINLMPLYNCFSNEQPSNSFTVSISPLLVSNPSYDREGLHYIDSNNPPISISDDNATISGSVSSTILTTTEITRTIYRSFDTKDNAYKIYMIPVKFGQQYTVAIDCDFSIECFCGLYSTHLITDNDLGTVAANNNIDYLEKNTYQKITNCSFNKPFVYNKLKNSTIIDTIYNQEDNLKLFIKIPVSNKSSIVVLEGDYTVDTNIMPDGTLHLAIPLYTINNSTNIRSVGTTKLQLLQLNSGIQHPFSNRLIEYLLNNVITSDEEISDNIKRVQQKAYAGIDVNGTIKKLAVNKYGVWDDAIRDYVYEIAADKIIRGSVSEGNAKTFLDLHTDILGYVDKDTEQLINGGK